MRKKFITFTAIIVILILTSLNSQLFAQPIILTETDIKEDADAVKILFSMNKSIPIECYDLTVPPQIVIDFMGEIYTNLSEVMMVNKGVVKQMRVIKGTKRPSELDESYYAVDFIIVDLKEAMRYDFRHGLTTTVLVISKPGKRVRTSLPKEKVEPKTKPPQQVSLLLDEKEYDPIEQPLEEEVVLSEEEQVVVVEEEVVAPAPAPQVKQKPVKKQSVLAKMKKGTKSVGRGISKGIGKVGKGIKKLFTFKKKKKAKDVKVVKKPRKSRKAQVKEKKVEVAKKPKKSRKAEVKRKEKKKPRAKFKSKKKKAMASKSRKKKAAALEFKGLSDTEKGIRLGERRKEEIAEELKKIKEGLNAAKMKFEDANAAQEMTLKDLNVARTKLERSGKEFEDGFQKTRAARDKANVAWAEYSEARVNLSQLLKKGAETSAVDAAQEKYDVKKAVLEKTIKVADKTKNESDNKLKAYHKTKEKVANLQASLEAPQKKTDRFRAEYEKEKKKVDDLNEEMAEVEQELVAAKRAHKQYELEEAEKEYRKSLLALDRSMLDEITSEDRAREAAKKAELKRIEEKKKDVEKKVAKEKKKRAAKEQKKVKPKSRRKSKKMSKKAAKRKEEKVEMLKTAIEFRNAGLEMHRTGDLDSALKYYQQALMQESQYSSVHNDLGILYEQKGLDERAKMEYLTALKIDPRYIKAHSNLALLYEKLENFDKAYYHWKQRALLGERDDPWTQKAEEKKKEYEQRR